MAVTTALATMVSLAVTLCLLEGLSLMAAAVPTAMVAAVVVVTLWLLKGLSLMAVAVTWAPATVAAGWTEAAAAGQEGPAGSGKGRRIETARCLAQPPRYEP